MPFGFGHHHYGPPPVNPVVGAVENATGMDLNQDGRIGNRPMYQQQQYAAQYGATQYGGPQQYGGPAYQQYGAPCYNAPPPVMHYGHYGQPPANPTVYALENATGMDLNGDGRVGNQPMYQHGGPQYGGPQGGYRQW
jgi:hypothetical protein